MNYSDMTLKELLTICENYECLPIETQGCLLSLVFNDANPKNIPVELLEQAHKFLGLLTKDRDNFTIQAMALQFEVEGALENERDT